MSLINLLETFLIFYFAPEFSLPNALICTFSIWPINKLQTRFLKFIQYITMMYLYNQNLKVLLMYSLFILLVHCPILNQRMHTEKLIWAIILIEGITGTKVPFWYEFCVAMIIYLLVFMVCVEAHKPRLVISTIVALVYYSYTLYHYNQYVIYLLLHKLNLIVFMGCQVLIGIAVISYVKNRFSLPNYIERKYFHLMALFLFIYPMINEVK